MIRATCLAALVLMIAAPAHAGAPPTTIPASPAEVDAACAAAGSGAEKIATGGLSGCRNTRTGGAVVCNANGQCKDYFADPRYAGIKAFIERNRHDRQQRPI